MYLRIVRPMPAELEGHDVSRLQMHVAYEVAAPLCDLLVMRGFAIVERRLGTELPSAESPKPTPDRRGSV